MDYTTMFVKEHSSAVWRVLIMTLLVVLVLSLEKQLSLCLTPFRDLLFAFVSLSWWDLFKSPRVVVKFMLVRVERNWVNSRLDALGRCHLNIYLCNLFYVKFVVKFFNQSKWCLLCWITGVRQYMYGIEEVIMLICYHMMSVIVPLVALHLIIFNTK